MGSKYCLYAINSYFASYLYHNGNPWVTPIKTNFLINCSDICIYFTLTLGAKLSDKIGVRITVFISLFLKITAYALLYFIPNYYVDLIAMCIFGLGAGIGILAYIKNALKFFPKSQGLVNGIILMGGGISASILTPLADFFIINSEKEKADDKGIYPKIISDRLPKFIFIILISFIIIGILSLFITFPYENIEEKNEVDKLINESEEKKNAENNGNLKEALFSTKNLMMISFCFCGFCKSNINYNII